jgi:hypothetical protein
MGAKLRDMLDEHIGVLEPLSLGSGHFLAARNCAAPRQQKQIVQMLS